MKAGVLAAVLACLVVVTSVASYIQYTHATEYKDSYAQKDVALYMAISAIFLLVGLVLAPLVCFQAGVWSTRTGVPAGRAASELAFMAPNHVLMFYGAIGAMVLINVLLYFKAHDDFITEYEEEESPVFDDPVKWKHVGKNIKNVMTLVALATVAILYIIYTQVNRAARDANIDMATGIAKSVMSQAYASEMRSRYP